MEFRIADTFTASLARLSSAEQKAAKLAAYDIQVDASAPGLRLHRIDKSKDANFWSARASDDIRVILHRTQASLLLCYVGHHDTAYAWAERRKIDIHPRTGAAQLVEVVERVEHVTSVAAPAAAELPQARKPFTAIAADQLLAYGVPPDWIAIVQATDEDGLFDLTAHLPAEAMDAKYGKSATGQNKNKSSLQAKGISAATRHSRSWVASKLS